MTKRVVIPVVLIVFAGLSYWLHSLNKTTPTHQNSPLGPDFYLEEFSSVSMDSKGLPKEKLQAKQLIHFEFDDHTELQQPRLTVVRSNETHYIIRANNGNLLSGNETLYLHGEVNIQRYNRSILATQMFTEELWIQSTANLAHTEKPVKIVHELGEIKAIGIVADLGSNKVELLHQVRGKYYARP